MLALCWWLRAQSLCSFLTVKHLCNYPCEVFLGSYSSDAKLYVRKVLLLSFVIWGLLAKETEKHNFEKELAKIKWTQDRRNRNREPSRPPQVVRGQL